MAILETKDLKKYYGSGDTLVKALDGVNLSVENGEFVAIVGTSGSGKSTLLHMLGGLDRPTSGTVTVGGKDIFSLKEGLLRQGGRRGPPRQGVHGADLAAAGPGSAAPHPVRGRGRRGGIQLCLIQSSITRPARRCMSPRRNYRRSFI